MLSGGFVRPRLTVRYVAIVKVGWREMRGSTGHGPRRERMLMANTSVTAGMVLLGMMILLSMVRLVRLVLVFVGHAHLHIPLMPLAPIHHHMLPLLMTLIEHSVGVMGRDL